MNTKALPSRWSAGPLCLLAILVSISNPMHAGAAAARQTSNSAHLFLAPPQFGWKLVSSPILAQPFQSLGIYAAVWNSSTGQYSVTPTAPADSFRPGQGYWIYLTQSVSVPITGAGVDSTRPFTIPLQIGWNMIGDPFGAAVPLSSLTLQNNGGGQQAVTDAVAAGATSPIYTYDDANRQYVGLQTGSQSLSPWAGAWLYATAPMSLVITPPAPASTVNAYRPTSLVSDVAGIAPTADKWLVNPWGIAISPSGNLRVVDNVPDVSTIYDANGVPKPGPQDGVGAAPFIDSSGEPYPGMVVLPGAVSPSTPGLPTGLLYNPASPPEFTLYMGITQFVPELIFSMANSHLAAGGDPQDRFGDAFYAAPGLPRTGAVYTGLALSEGAGGPVMNAADFQGGGVDFFDMYLLYSGTFTDPGIPAGFAPFNIANIGGNLYVSYAKQAGNGIQDEPGAGNGFIDVFSPDGTLLKRLVSNGVSNSPWGMALAPADFGAFSNSLLVANHGDGTINAFDLSSGAYLGTLADITGNPIVIDGLWGIVFGNGAGLTQTNTLYFTAGPQGGTHGLLGKIEVAGLATGSAGG